MQYRHITLGWTLEGLSPKKFISDMESEGFETLYTKVVSIFCSFLHIEDPFEHYKKIKTRRSDKEEKERDSLRDQIAAGKVPFEEVRQKYMHFSEDVPSFGDLFRNKKYPDVVFSLVDCSAEKLADNEKREWQSELWLSCWSNDTYQKANLQEIFESFITSVLKVVGCDKNAQEIARSDTFSVTHEGMIKDLAEYNLKQASFEDKKKLIDLISERKIREILIEFNKKSSILLSEFLNNTAFEKRDSTNKLNFLSGQGLLEKNLVVICKKTSQWWNMAIPSAEMLGELEKAGVTCTSCGAKISEERIDTLFKISQKGSELISGSLWMVGNIVESLRKLGCRPQDIFADIRYEGDQIDVLALILGMCVVFELKDREFGLGDAYKFHGKVSRLRQKVSSVFPIVVTTKTIAAEARKLLGEVTPHDRNETEYIEYQLVEGLDNLQSELGKWMDQQIRQIVSKRLQSVKDRFPAKSLILNNRHLIGEG